MFWGFEVYQSNIKNLIKKEDVSLNEILDEEDVLQEAKGNNDELIEYLLQPNIIEQLVSMAIDEPPEDVDEVSKYKYPNIACEILTCDNEHINNILVTEEKLLLKIYSFLEKISENFLLASFFSKIMAQLIIKKGSEMLSFLSGRDDFVGKLLDQLHMSAMMDLLLKLITCTTTTSEQMSCSNWLNEQKLIQRLVSMVHPSQSEDKHCNAALCLCDIIRVSRDQMSSLQEKAEEIPLLVSVESTEIISDLLSNMVSAEKNESVIVNGLSVIQTLLEYKKMNIPSFQIGDIDGGGDKLTALDTERLANSINKTFTALIPRLTDLHQILLEPPSQHYSPMPTTVGTLNLPLGNCRLQVTHLICHLLMTNTHSINVQLANIGTISVLLDLFFVYSLNNFLHTQVEMCIKTILTSSTSAEPDSQKENILLNQLFSECAIIQRFLDAWDENDKEISKQNGQRKGYMGHLIRASNSICENAEKGPNSEKIKEFILELSSDVQERWNIFVSKTLANVNKESEASDPQSHILKSSSEDESPSYHDIDYSQSSQLQESFSVYQKQQMTGHFIENFGYNPETFSEQDESVDAPFTNRISSIDFNTKSDSPDSARALFEQTCNAKIQQFDDADSEEDTWDEKEVVFARANDSLQKPDSGTFKLDSLSGDIAYPDRLSGASSIDDDDESTDSEEDIESPRVIHQKSSPNHVPTLSSPDSLSTLSKQADSMEVDLPGKGFKLATEADQQGFQVQKPVTVPMEVTSPWNNEESDKNEQNSDWANFSSFSPNSSTSPNVDTWPNFSDITSVNNESDKLSSEKANSPVAMETLDSPGRTYLVSIDSSGQGAADSDNKSGTLSTCLSDHKDDCASKTENTTLTNTRSSENSIDSTLNSDTTVPVVPDEENKTVISSVHSTDNPPAATSVCPNSVVDPTQIEPIDDSDIPPSHPPPPPPVEQDDEDNLSANFNFLAATGLIKSNEQSLSDEVKIVDPVEIARSKARQAQEAFATFSSTHAEINSP